MLPLSRRPEHHLRAPSPPRPRRHGRAAIRIVMRAHRASLWNAQSVTACSIVPRITNDSTALPIAPQS